MSTKMADENKETTSKREYGEVDSSPGMTPPSKLIQADPETKAFTYSFLGTLGDDRVVDALKKILLQPMIDIIKEKDEKIKSLTENVETLKTKVKALQSDVSRLTNGQDELEQYGRRNSIRIWTDEPEKQGEDTDSIVLDYAKKAGVTISSSDISRSHRVGRPPIPKQNNQKKPRPIIVKFTSYNTRQKVYESRKKVDGTYVSEDLTKLRSNLLYQARQERKNARFLHCWTNDGRIKIRLPSKVVHTVTTQDDLDQLIADVPAPGHD